MKYLICNFGCDDTTECEVELSEKELDILIKIAKEINKNSECICQPRIGIFKKYIKEVYNEEDENEWYWLNYTMEDDLLKCE